MRTPHYLTGLKTTKIPRIHAVFDCETRASRKHGRLAHRWACGGAAIIGKWGDGSYRTFEARTTKNPERLWRAMVSAHGAGGEMVVWAHNLAFDLRISEALRLLPQMGYRLDAIVLEKTAAWAAFTGDAGKLTVCDLHSWLPFSLNRIAAAMGTGRPDFDYDAGTDSDLRGRCLFDVERTAEAVCEVLDFLESEHAGPFRPTGSGQSHSMWRHRFFKEKTILVHADEYALERERTAMWAGRAEAWSWGEVNGPLYEHDLNLAYCRIAATHRVPVKLTGRTGPRTLDEAVRNFPYTAVLADVTIATDVPVVPTGDAGRVLWPVGTFKTTLWTPELILASEAGARITIHRTWQYRCEPVLAPMAQWLIEELEVGNGKAGAVAKLLLKHWARTLVGRCALRYRQWDDYGTVPTMGLSLSNTTATAGEDAKELLQVGERVFELAEMAESDSSVPQITGFVMSVARANLWQVIGLAGGENVHYMDTDSVLVNGAGHRRLRVAGRSGGDVHLVHKSTFGKARIYGPRNIVLEDERRISGVPKKAKETGHLEFDGEVWTGLRTSIESHQASSVGVQSREFHVDDSDPRRRRVTGGRTIPHGMD